MNYVRDFQGRIGGIFRSIQVISSPSLRREVSFVYLIYWTIYESGGGKSEIDEEKRGTRKKYIYMYSVRGLVNTWRRAGNRIKR